MWLKLLRALASLDAEEIEDALTMLSAIIKWFGVKEPQAGTTGALENVHMSEEETALVEQISQKITARNSAKGTQAAFDWSRIRGLAKKLEGLGLMDAIISILLKRAGAL
jgi:hypothetical protein